MVALKNKLGAAAAVGFLVAACSVTSTTTNPGDGGTSSSSGSSGTSSGSSGTSSGSSGTSSGSSGTSSGGTDSGTCPPPASIKFTEPDGGLTCDTCAHAKCQTQIDGCFKDTSAAACDCRALEACVQTCQAGDNACVQGCIDAHPTGLPLGNTWRGCVFGATCGPTDAGGDGSCQ